MDLDDIVGNVETIERLKVIARDGNMPHIIISVTQLQRLVVDVGNARYWKDDKYHGPCTRVTWRCIQRRRT